VIIECDKCAARFRLDDSRVTGAGVKVRCTKCKDVFIVRPPGSEGAAADTPASPASEKPETREDPSALSADEGPGDEAPAPGPPAMDESGVEGPAAAPPASEPAPPQPGPDIPEQAPEAPAPPTHEESPAASAPEPQAARDGGLKGFQDEAGPVSLDDIDFSFSKDRSDEDPVGFGSGWDDDEGIEAGHEPDGELVSAPPAPGAEDTSAQGADPGGPADGILSATGVESFGLIDDAIEAPAPEPGSAGLEIGMGMDLQGEEVSSPPTIGSYVAPSVEEPEESEFEPNPLAEEFEPEPVEPGEEPADGSAEAVLTGVEEGGGGEGPQGSWLKDDAPLTDEVADELAPEPEEAEAPEAAAAPGSSAAAEFSEALAEAVSDEEAEAGREFKVADEDEDEDEEEEDEDGEDAAKPSRRVPAAAIAVLIFAIGIAGIYFSGVVDMVTRRFVSGPEAQAGKTVEIEGMKGYYVVNKALGRVFVIEAKIRNLTGAPQGIKSVRGSIYNARGEAAASRTASPGRVLSREELSSLPKDELERSVRGVSGGTVPARGTLPVMVVFTALPQGMDEFGIDIVR